MRAFFASALPDNPRILAYLLIFVLVFVVIVAWQLRPSNRAQQEQASKLPFQD